MQQARLLLLYFSFVLIQTSMNAANQIAVLTRLRHVITPLVHLRANAHLVTIPTILVIV